MSIFLTSPYFELLCQSIQPVDTDNALERAEEIISHNVIDWEELYERADMNAVKPQLGRLLTKMPAQLVPASILKKLEAANRENLYLQLQNVSEYLKIKKQLDEVGIVAVPFKGFWLAGKFYDNLADRESVDVDLFINPGDIEKIKLIMFSRGYVAEDPLPELTDEYILNELCEYNFDQYNGDNRIFHFEFHWRISLQVYGLNITLDELQTQIINVTLQHTELKVFTPSANLLLAIMHHGGKDQFLQLKQVLDIVCILKQETGIDWEWVAGKAAKYNMEKLLYVSVKIASLLAGIAVPDQIKAKVNHKRILSLANNRISMMGERRSRGKNYLTMLNNFYFRIRSRSSAKLRIRMFVHEFRTEVLTQLVPKQFRHFFWNKKIRIKAGS
jgi:hypothetical protein